MEDEKKITAAVSAVLHYMDSEQAQYAPFAQNEIHQAAGFASHPQPNMWRFSGRMAQMQMRNMMQMKVYK